MTVALIDNDVLHKTAVYGLALSLLQTRPYNADSFHILTAAKFMIVKKITKTPPSRGMEKAIEEFEAVLQQLNQLEPTEDEIELAAQFEYLAGKNGEELDGGESLLCAVLITRQWNYLFTGDKRAIKGISTILSHEGEAIAGRVVCLEQLFDHLIRTLEPSHIRTCVCAEPKVDTALTNCFSCRSAEFHLDSCKGGLDSYIDYLRTNAPNVLSQA